MIIVDDLKYAGYESSSKHMLAILMILPRHALLLIIHLRWDYNSLSGPGADDVKIVDGGLYFIFSFSFLFYFSFLFLLIFYF